MMVMVFGILVMIEFMLHKHHILISETDSAFLLVLRNLILLPGEPWRKCSSVASLYTSTWILTAVLICQPTDILCAYDEFLICAIVCTLFKKQQQQQQQQKNIRTLGALYK